MSLVSTTDLARYLQRDLTATEQESASLLLDLIDAEVADATGQTYVAATDETATLDIPWSGDIELPHSPVTSVTSVSVDGVALASTAWTLVGNLLRLGLGYGPPSVATVVYSSAGTLPMSVASIVLAAAARSLMSAGNAGVRQETIGSYSVTYADAGEGGLLTAFDRKRLRLIAGRNAGTITVAASGAPYAPWLGTA